MSAEHKAALAVGREQGRAIRAYLDALEAHRPKRGRKRTPDSIKKRLNAIKAEMDEVDALGRLNLIQEQTNLEQELEMLTAKNAMADLEAGFIEHAADYSDRKGIAYETWKRMGVPPAMLKKAGITR